MLLMLASPAIDHTKNGRCGCSTMGIDLDHDYDISSSQRLETILSFIAA